MGKVFMTKTEKNLTDKKLVGAHIIKEDANRIALLSLEKGIPRTAIFLKLVNDYLIDQDSLSDMIEKAVNRAYRVWKEQKEKTPLSLRNFCQEMDQDLTSHRIEKDIIRLIIFKLKERIPLIGFSRSKGTK